MGGSFSALMKEPRVKIAYARLTRLVNTAWWVGGHVIWTAATAFIVLAAPVLFEYEKECIAHEQMQAVQKAQMDAALQS